MADGKRDAKGFEPPPWERQAFEELRRRREAEAADREIAEAVDALRVGPEAPQETPPPSAEPPEPEPTVVAAPTAEAAEEDPEPPLGGVDEKRVAEMLAELAAQEPRALRDMWVVEIGSGGFLMFLGLTVFVWGLVGGARAASNPGAAPFALVMIVFGASFVALGLWLVRRGLRNRGV